MVKEAIANPNFPRYLVDIGGERKFLSIQEAGIWYDCGHVRVEICGEVIEADFSVREITKEERERICEIADEYSGNK